MFSQLGDVHPVIVDDVFDKLFLAFVLPEEGSVGPFILSAVLCDLIANFIEIDDDFG